MPGFSEQLAAIAAKHKARADAIVREAVQTVVMRIDNRSPVGNPLLWKNPAPKGYVGGHFRNNWQLADGAAPVGELAGVDQGGARLAANLSAIPQDAAGRVYFYVNHTPYARVLEEGSHSKQVKPNGMVGLTAIEWPTILDDAVKGIPA